MLLVDSSLQPAQIQKRLLEAQPHLLPLLGLHHSRSFAPLPLRAPRQPPHQRQVSQQSVRGANQDGVLFLELALRPKEKSRIFQNAPAHIPRSFSPGPVQVTDFAAGELVLRNGLRQDLAVLSLRASQRHQVLDRRLGRNAPGADLLLDRLGQNLDEREPLQDPAHAPVKPLRQILVAQGKIPQFLKQPPLLDRRLRVRCSQRPVEHQGVRLVHVPQRGLDGVRAQPLHQAHALVAVDELVSARVLD